MKKKLCLFCTLIFVLVSSCSSDSDSSPGDLVLPKKIYNTYPSSPYDNDMLIFSYDGNKIREIAGLDSKTVYIYEAGLISKKIKYNVDDKGKESKEFEVNYN
jgi:hypothetical protein